MGMSDVSERAIAGCVSSVADLFRVAIQAPAHPAPLHPLDKALLRPIAALGKKKVAEANVSFLRRTEYISSLTSKRIESGTARTLLNTAKRPVRRAAEQAADSPQVIKRKIDRGFELAAEERKHYKRIKHPSKRNLELVDATPLLPDLDSFPDSGAFVTIKFATRPVEMTTEYDKRLLASFFRPIDRTPQEEAAYEAALEAHAQDPDEYPKPQNFMNYEFFLPRSRATAENFRRKFDVDNPDKDDDSLYTDGDCFQFNRVRAYETAQETELNHITKYSHEIILASHDKDEYPKQKAVYYYPVLQKSTIRSQRTKNIARTIGYEDEEEEKVEQLDLKVADANEEMLEAMKRYREHPLGWEEEEEEEEAVEALDDEDEPTQRREQSQDAEGEEAGTHHRESSPRERRYRSSSEPQDAEGEDDD